LSPKTKTSRRTIDIDPLLVAELEKHRARQNVVRMEHRKTYHDAGFIFARLDAVHGYPFTRHAIERRMYRLLRLSEIKKKLSPHSLRHTHTSLLAEIKVSLEAIMKRLGHKDDRMTRLVYLHVTRTVQREASEKFSELMQNVVKM
jgi:integrase